MTTVINIPICPVKFTVAEVLNDFHNTLCSDSRLRIRPTILRATKQEPHDACLPQL